MRDYDWTEPRLVQTKNGPRYLRTLPLEPGHPFWDQWGDDKLFLKSQGFTCGKLESGEWEARLWTMGPEWPGEEGYAQPIPKPERLPEIDADGLLPYQIDHVRRLVGSLNKNHIAVDKSMTGTGKTSCAIVACRNIGMKPLIVCPKSVKGSWRRWCERLGVEPLDIVNYEMLRTGKLEWVDRVSVSKKKPGYLQFNWNLPANTCVVWDEAHKLSGRSTLQAFMGAALRSHLSKYRKCMILSATLAQSPLDMRATGFLMGLHSWGNYYDWAQSNGVVNGRFGLFFPEDKAEQNLVRLHHQIFPSLGGGLTVEDAKGFFPENRIIAETYDLGDEGKLEAVYQEMRDAIREQKAKEKRDRGWNPMVEMLRAQQHAEILKIPTLTEMAKDAIAEGSSVVIFVNFISTLEELKERLDCPVIYGQQNDAQRQDAIDTFQSDKAHAIVCQIQAGGVGVSLHQDEAWKRPRTSLICPCFDGRLLKQALGRIHRSGAKDGVVQRIVFGEGSAVEERACRAIERKVANMDLFNDGELLDPLTLLEDEEETSCIGLTSRQK